jgi:uncharacterized Fe-S cluster-containing radical SAM superfamily protein
LERAKSLEPIACKGRDRKYYRFRPAKWYGGIVTGDVVACNLLCHFCWAGDDIRAHPEKVGKFYSPEQVFKKLDTIAKKFGYKQMRLSGQEPTIGFEHLVALLELVGQAGYSFILETNGILLGAEPGLADMLSGFEGLHVRVSLKGANKDEFNKLTGANPDSFALQLEALKNLLDSGVSCHPAIMVSFSSEESLSDLTQRLRAIDKGLVPELEIEELILYPHVTKRLKKLGIEFEKAHDPRKLPGRLV